MLRKEGVMLMIKNDELRCFMEFNEETINTAVRRILAWKYYKGMIE